MINQYLENINSITHGRIKAKYFAKPVTTENNSKRRTEYFNYIRITSSDLNSNQT